MSISTTPHYVIGGGPLGRTTMRHLVDSGAKATLVSRSKRSTVGSGRQIVGEIADPNVQSQIREGSVLYHCANAPYHKWSQELPALWDAVTGLAIEKRCTLVVATNVYSYGEPSGTITESHEKRPHTRKGIVRNEVESKVIDAVTKERLQAVLVRGSDFFGPEVNDSVVGSRFFSALLRGKQPTFTGALDQPHSYTFLPDYVRTMIAAAAKIDSGTHDGRTELIVPNSKAVTALQLSERLEIVLGRKLKPRAIGAGTLRLGGLFVPAAHEVIEMLYEFDRPFLVDGSEASKYLGIDATELDRALSDTVQWYRDHFQAKTTG